MAHELGLPFDPIPRAAELWRHRWGTFAEAMAAATSIMRVQQLLLAAFDAVRPHGLTFARYEALVLLAFSRAASCRWARSASG